MAYSNDPFVFVNVTYLSDKVNMTLSFLYRRRTIRWYPVFSVGMTLLRCICHS